MAAISFIPEPTGSTPPSGSTVNFTPVPFEYEVDDVTQGIAAIEFSFDNSEFHSVTEGQSSSVCSAFTQTGVFYLDLAHGIYTLYFRVIDQLNNIGPVTSWNLTVDIFTNISIDPLPTITNNPTLLVTGVRESGATVTVFLNDNSIAGVTYPTNTTWKITLILTEGQNQIKASATDVESNVATTTTSITLDTTIPGVPVVTQIDPAELDYVNFTGNSVLTNQPSQTIIGLKEAGTSVWLNGSQVVALDDQDTFSFSTTLTEGGNTLSLKTIDAASNESETTDVNITLDTIAPLNPDIVINDDVGFTLTRNVIVRLTADGAVEYKLSEDVNFINAEFSDFTSPLLVSYELSRGGGTKTVYAIFRDQAGNETVPVFDTIVLPSTLSTQIDKAADMTIQELDISPEDDYLVRLQDNRDGTFSIEIYEDLTDAIAQVNRKGYATSSTPGQQTLNLIPDIGGIDAGGTITVTLIEGAELVIYRFRTDVYDLSLDESGVPITYTVEETQSYDAKTSAPFFEGFTLGRITEYAVDGDQKKHRITKSFDLYDSNTAIVRGVHYEVVDSDGASYPIEGAYFDYPLLPTTAKVLSITEETNDYLVILDRDIERFDPLFGYEMLFTKRDREVTDYHIDDDGRVEFYNESGRASGNVQITYRTPATISSNPSSEFKPITATIGSLIRLTVMPTVNRILLSDLDKIIIRFYHSVEDSVISSPTYARAVVNDTYLASNANFRIVEANERAEIREFAITSDELFPGGISPITPADGNEIIEKVEVEFVAESINTFIDELQIVARSSVVSSNCRIIVNGEEKYISTTPVSSIFDDYEIQVQDSLVDFICNGECVHTEFLNLDNATISVGAGGRDQGDIVRATFDDLQTIEYMDNSPTTLNLGGRATEVEANLRGGALLRSFEVDFKSAEAQYPNRTYVSDAVTADFLDTATVAIIGMGKREEILVQQGLGEEDEGEPIDFTASNLPDGRHFKVISFPIIESTLEVLLTHDGVERVLIADQDFQLDTSVGCIVLHHPIELNDRLVVKYSSEADTNVPYLFTDLSSLISRFGQPSIENTLSLGAQLAFQNGAKRVVAIQALDPAVDPRWTQAYQALSKVDTYYVVPIPPSEYPLVASLGLTHVENQSSTKYRNERILILGETIDMGVDDISLYRNSTRTVFLAPGDLSTVLNGETAQLDGRYLAAAYAGKLSSFGSLAEPAMNKRLTGFVIDSQNKYSRLQLETLVQKGVTIIRREAVGGIIYRSVTTSDSTNAVDQEQSVVRVADFIAINLRNVLENRFIGRPIVELILEEIRSSTTKFLEVQIAKRIITKFEGVQVRVDSQDPRQVNVTFDIEPAFPLVDIPVTINVVTTL